jgi:hypothetical protein
MDGFKAGSHGKARHNPNVEATKSSLAAKLASDRFRRVTCEIEYRPVFGPPFDA